MSNIVFASSGLITSNALDTVSNVSYSTIDWSATTPTDTSITVKVRTDDSSDMSGATDWSSCAAVTNGQDLSSNNCVTDGDRYVQYQASFQTSNTNVSASLESITINFKAEEE